MSEHEKEPVEAEVETEEEARIISLTERVDIIEARLGIDPHAVVADAEESAARGAEAAALSEPAIDESDEDESGDEEPEVEQS